MSTTNTVSNDSVQELIDLRLDAIDRALLGLLPRNERQAMVAQVESRIREATAATEANQASPGQRAISESVVRTAESAAEASSTSDEPAVTRAAGRLSATLRKQRSRVAVSSGVLGMVALALLVAMPFTYLIATLFSEFEMAAIAVLGAHVAAVAIGGTVAVVLGIIALVRLNRRSNRLVGHGWAITGLCTGPLPMFVGGLMALVVGVELLGTGFISVTEVQTAEVPQGGYPVAASVDPSVSPNAPVVQYAAVPATTSMPSYAPGGPAPISPAPVVAPVASNGDVCEERLSRQRVANSNPPVPDFAPAPDNFPPADLPPSASAPAASPTR